MSDWDHRQLCPDGSCVGLIGADGTCKVCGRAAPNWGDERKRGMVEADAHDGEADDDEDDDHEDDEEYEDDDGDGDGDGDADEDDSGSISAEADGDWSKRSLCPDGACVGLIGDNGACNVCGRSAA